MAYEHSFNKDFARKLAKSDTPDVLIDSELKLLKERVMTLNNAREHMSEGFAKVLEGLKMAFPDLDLNDKNLLGTPNRMARALIEVCSGLGVSQKEIFDTTFPAENYDEVIILKDIEYNSLCSHHFFPFVGKAHIGYLPNTHEGSESKVVGLSKLAHIVDAHASRPQLQERMCQGIMDAIRTELKPAGVMVVVEGVHGCLTCRGAKKSSASMITSALDGRFKDDPKLRAEFLSLVKKS
jgi:GTP cyclohydrolase I